MILLISFCSGWFYTWCQSKLQKWYRKDNKDNNGCKTRLFERYHLWLGNKCRKRLNGQTEMWLTKMEKTTYMLGASWKITLWPRVSNATVSVANVENAHHSTRWVLEKLIIQHSTSFHRVVWRLSLKLWDLEILTKDL